MEVVSCPTLMGNMGSEEEEEEGEKLGRLVETR